MASFYEDVIKNDPRFNSVKRVNDPELLEPVTRAAINSIVEDARALGIDLMVFETYPVRPASRNCSIKVPQSCGSLGVHHYGLACDLVKVVRDAPYQCSPRSFEVRSIRTRRNDPYIRTRNGHSIAGVQQLACKSGVGPGNQHRPGPTRQTASGPLWCSLSRYFSMISWSSSELTTSRISCRFSATCCACCLPPIILSRTASPFAVNPSIAA
jgi:hypothetical protein